MWLYYTSYLPWGPFCFLHLWSVQSLSISLRLALANVHEEYVINSNAEEAEVERFYEDLQDL